MDIISFNEAATANSRIEKINANPDSTSGIVTQPSVIQSGETVSIPTGRTAIMANTQIDGTITLDGTMFIPSGATTTDIDTKLSTKIDKVTSTDNAIARYDGTTGKLQNSSVIIDDVGNLGIGVTPSASTIPTIQSQYGMLLGNDESNISTNSYYSGGMFKYNANGSAVSYIHQKVGGSHTWRTAPSGTAGNPITWTNAMTLGSNGNLLIGTTTDNGVDKLQVSGSIVSGLVRFVTDLNEVKRGDGSLLTGDFTFSLASNAPCIHGTLHQIARSSAECTQMVIDIVTGKLYTRVYLGTTWPAWVEK